MIRAIFYQDENNIYYKFELRGHAGFLEYGNDIVCAAVSILAVNTVNSIETFTKDTCIMSEKEKNGILKYEITSTVSSKSQLLLRSFLLGLQSIRDIYGKKYISIKILKKYNPKEV